MREVQHEIKITVDRASFRDVINLKYSDYSIEALMQLVKWIEGGLIGLPYNIEVCTYINQDPNGQNDKQVSKCVECTGGYCEEECLKERDNDEE